jgi:hypothetical protein
MELSEEGAFDEAELGLLVFDDVETPLEGWQVGSVVERVFGPEPGYLCLGNQKHRIDNGRSAFVLPASFLPVGIDEIGEEWSCPPMQPETLLTVAKLVRRVFAVALRLAKTVDASANMEALIAADSLSAFFAPRFVGLKTARNDEESLLTFEAGKAPEHYVRVSARRPRLLHLADALDIGGVSAEDPAAQAIFAFVESPYNAVSWSAGIVAEAVLHALSDRIGLERVLGEEATLAFADLGYPVTYAPGGRITARIQPAAREAFVRTMIENGYLPDNDTLDDGDLRDVAEGFRWGGGEASRAAVWARLSNRRDLLWNLDKAALVR